MKKSSEKPKSLIDSLEDHGAEGIEIMTSQPSRLFGLMIWLILAMLLAALAWSFFGRAPEIVTARGTLGPDGEVRRFYAPIAGELVDIFVAEGQPVTKGEILARLNARGAIEAAMQALEAQINLEAAERDYDHFPERKTLMERKAAALKRQIEVAERLHERRVAEGLEKLKRAQRARLQEVLGSREKARRKLEIARKEKAKYERLLKGGGVSRDQVELKRSEYLAARANFSVAEARLGALEFELGQEDAEATSGLEESYQKLTDLRIELETLQDSIVNEESKLKLALRSARLRAETASRVSFDDIDEENFLRIRAPESGVLTQLSATQVGDKVRENTPLGGIAPVNAETILNIEIAESDRGLLHVGSVVRIKLNAFPYQRFGFIQGVLEYISPVAQPSSDTGAPVFKGRVRLDKDYFEVGKERYVLRYGMVASAEIIIRERRIIDLVLDPFRKMRGG